MAARTIYTSCIVHTDGIIPVSYDLSSVPGGSAFLVIGKGDKQLIVKANSSSFMKISKLACDLAVAMSNRDSELEIR